MSELVDSFGRSINYLRISVTDRCNLRCIYCMPSEGVPSIPHSEVLSYEEISTVTQVTAGLGINRVRLTGGEPLVRAELPKLVGMLSQIKGIDEVSLTTNGTLLRKHALALKEAGLKRINVSLDTLKVDKFRRITRVGELKDTLDGIEAARDAGFEPVKINMVVMQGANDDELLDFASMTYKEGWHVRFIELMPFADIIGIVPCSEIRQRISSLGALESCRLIGSGPARYYRFPGAKGTIGLICPISEPFCSRCNRLRLTSYGQLCPCLLSEDGIDLKGPLRSKVSMQEIERLIVEAIVSKPKQHRLAEGMVRMKRNMSRIGG
jgi:cyclic pyranopterin phosphate synthase